jgi:hypothetical protein
MMKKLATLAIIGLAGLFVSASVAEGDPTGPPNGLDVHVVNPPSSPVPVDVVGTPGVGVSNTPENPLYVRDVDRRAKTSFLDGCQLWIQAGETSDTCAFDRVEVGKRLVVEFISGWIAYPVGQTGQAHTIIERSPGGGFFQNHYLLQTLQRGNVSGEDRYVVSQPFRIDLDQEQRLEVRVIRHPDDTDDVIGTFWVTGSLVEIAD